MKYMYRIYTTDDRKTYTMHQINANSIHEAIYEVEQDTLDADQIISCTRYNHRDDSIVTDPFLAALLLSEINECFDHLKETNYDTSRLAAILGSYLDGDLDEQELH
jgi:hypothetical protein